MSGGFPACSAFLFGIGMATIEAVLKSTLAGDATLAAILTGGVKNASDDGFDEGGSNAVPRDSDGVTVLPFAVIRWQASTRTGEVDAIRGETGMVEIYVYDDTGYVQIELALSRIIVLVDMKELSGDNRQLAYFKYIFLSGELPKEATKELGGIAGKFIRFSVTQVR